MVGDECFKRSWLGGRVFHLEHVKHRWRVWVLVVGGAVYMEDAAAAFVGHQVQGCAGLPPPHQVCKSPRQLAVNQ